MPSPSCFFNQQPCCRSDRPALPGYSRRFAGRLETGAHLVSDPAMFGPAIADQQTYAA